MPGDAGTGDGTTEVGSPTDAMMDVALTDSSDAAMCRSSMPPSTANFCATKGCALAPLSVPLCDGSGTYSYYTNDYCDASATVISIVAGWCVPAEMEASMIETMITQGYAGRGVRVITVYAQAPDGSTPTAAQCLTWQTTYSLTSHMTFDTMGVTNVFTPGNAFPANVVVDEKGDIYDIVYGTSSSLTTLDSDLNSVLTSEGF